MLLGVDTDHERRDIDDLLPDADVPLPDQDAGVVDGFSEAQFEDEGLEAALEDVGGGQGEDVVELGLRLVQEAVAVHAAHQGGPLEDALGVLVVEGEEGAGGLIGVYGGGGGERWWLSEGRGRG